MFNEAKFPNKNLFLEDKHWMRGCQRVSIYQPSILKHDTLILLVLIFVPEFLVQILEETAGGEKQVLA